MKNMTLSHTRHRSSTNACVNILSYFAAYQLKENKATPVLTFIIFWETLCLSNCRSTEIIFCINK